jgi:hypothetical protein
MITMIDEIFDRQYQAGRTEMNAAILALGRRFAAGVGNAFSVLNRIEYSAPWSRRAKEARRR